MPKIFGDVTLGTAGRLFCRRCGYKWEPTDVNMIDIRANHRITCPVCRIIKDKDINGFIDDKNTVKAIPSSLLKASYKQLTTDWHNFEFSVISKCGHRYPLKEKDILDNSKCPICNRNKIRTATIAAMEPKIRVANAKSDWDKAKKVEKDKIEEVIDTVRETKIAPVPMENTDINTKKTEQDEQVERTEQVENNSNTKLTRAEALTKARKVRSDNKMNKIRETIQEMQGTVYGKQVIINGIDSNNQCICTCIHCGLEMHIPTSQIINKDRRQKALQCDTCKNNLNGSEAYVDNLINRYIGKVYNGLEIIEIYCDEEDDITKCTVECMASREVTTSGYKSGHIMEDVPFGDLINYRVHCTECEKNDRVSEKNLSNVLSGSIICRNFKLENNFIGMAVGVGARRLTVGDIYSGDGSLCDYCTSKSRCNMNNKDQMSFSIIRTLRDGMYNLTASANDVHARFPNIYSSMDKNASIYKVKTDTGLQVFRDAYIGRDGRIYKFCKCSIHRTELIMNESEINSFNHEQCTTKFNNNMKFFNVDNKYLLSNSDKTGGK